MRSPWHRAVATLVGVWFALSVSGVALQLCPEHGMQMMAAMHHTGADCAPGGSHEHGAIPSGQPEHHSGSRQQPGSHDDCTCTGTCCVTAAVTLAAPRLVPIPIVEAETPVIVALGTRELAPRAAPDVTLPPPLGPPTLRA